MVWEIEQALRCALAGDQAQTSALAVAPTHHMLLHLLALVIASADDPLICIKCPANLLGDPLPHLLIFLHDRVVE